MAPTQLGPYRIVEELARGGMGVVYRGVDPRLEREVALKVILPQWVDADNLARFQTEALAAGRLRHPNIVGLLDVGTEQGAPYLVMELVDGPSVQSRLKDGPFDGREAARIACALADALRYAHGQQVLHRDLKPHNVLLDPRGEPRLTDFGLAKLIDQGLKLTRTGEVLGTPVYMAPEQVDGEPPDVRTDVYGLGAVLYAMLTGRPPYEAQGTVQALNAVISRPPTTPGEVVSGLDPRLERICLRCLAREPGDRFPDMAAVHGALTEFLRPRRVREVSHTGRWVPVAAALVGLGVGAAVALAVRPAPAPAPAPMVASDPLPTLRIANAAVRKSPAAALELCERVLAEHPRHPIAWTVKGKALRFLGRPDDAAHALDQAVRLDPDDYRGYLVRAELWFDKGDFVSALADIKRAEARQPRLVGALTLRGSILAKQDRYPEALAVLDSALELEGDNPQALVPRGDLLLNLKRPQEALDNAVHLNGVRPRLIQGWIQRGHALTILKRYREAQAAFEHAATLAPRAYEPRWRLGAILLLIGEQPAASIGQFDIALQEAKTAAQRTRVLGKRALAHGLAGRAREARSDLHEADLPENAPDRRLTLGLIAFAEKDYKGAITHLSWYLKRSGHADPRLVARRAEAFERTGELRAASRDFRRAAKLYEERGHKRLAGQAAERARALRGR